MPKITKLRLHFVKIIQRKLLASFFRTRCVYMYKYNIVYIQYHKTTISGVTQFTNVINITTVATKQHLV